MGDVVRVVENTVKEVGKGVENVTREISSGLTTAGQLTSNAGNLVGGDVGKAINAVTNPAGAMLQAGGSLVEGDIKGAVARSAGSFLAGNTQVVAASSSAKELFQNENFNTLTMGFSNDISQVDDAKDRMIARGEISDQDFSAVGRFGVRTAAVIGTAGVVNAFGGASGVGTAAVNAGKSGVGFLQTAGTVAAGAAAIAKDPGKAAASYLGIDTSGLEDTIDQIDGIRRDVESIIPQPSANRSPASVSASSPQIIALPGGSTLGLMPIVAMGAAGLVALILILKRK